MPERPPTVRNGGRLVPAGSLHVPEDWGRDVRGDLGQDLQTRRGLSDGGRRPDLPGPVLSAGQPSQDPPAPQSAGIKETQTEEPLNLPGLGGQPQVQLQHHVQHQE